MEEDIMYERESVCWRGMERKEEEEMERESKKEIIEKK
jgi:hypothetical protein